MSSLFFCSRSYIDLEQVNQGLVGFCQNNHLFVVVFIINSTICLNMGFEKLKMSLVLN